MKRDGASKSLWQDKLESYVSTTTTIPMHRFDVVIVGGGVTGITTALELQKAGKKCIVAEAHSLCFGTTGGTTAHLNSFFDTSYDQILKDFGEDAIHLVANAAGRALELYKQNVEQYNMDCNYSAKDGYVYASDDKQAEQLEKMYAASRLAGVDVSYTDRIPLPIEFTKAIVYREQAQVHPTRYVYALAKEFEQAGGIIVQNCFVEDVVENDGTVVVKTNIGVIQGSYLVYATTVPSFSTTSSTKQF